MATMLFTMKNAYPFFQPLLEKYHNSDPDYRFLVGIVGPPAAGKSYLAEKLPIAFNEHFGSDIATHFNMDAYHRTNDELYKKGIYPHKGAHFTFDVEKFIEKLLEIKEEKGEVFCPVYDRSRSHDPIPDSHIVKTHHKIVVVEGNYLLSKIHPWISIRHILNYCIFIEVDEIIQYPRLLDRHMKSGKSRKEAEDKINRTDLPNAQLILQDKSRADFIYTPEVNLHAPKK